MSEIQYSVEVKDVEKHFKVYMDKEARSRNVQYSTTETATKTDRF